MIAVTHHTQETESSCGPAVIAMLLGFLNKNITQNDFIEAAEYRDWLEKHGTQPWHMAKAISVLAPDLQFWVKDKSSLEDLQFLVNEKKWPVAVNWQGLFYEKPEDEPSYPSPEAGHYSIIVSLDTKSDTITILDPYPEFSHHPRTFSLKWFLERWWDVGDQLDPKTQKITKFLTNKLLFIVTSKFDTFPLDIHMSQLSVKN